MQKTLLDGQLQYVSLEDMPVESLAAELEFASKDEVDNLIMLQTILISFSINLDSLKFNYLLKSNDIIFFMLCSLWKL